MHLQVTLEALVASKDGLQGLPDSKKSTGTYVGCMFVDHMQLLQQGYGLSSTGPVMTGETSTHFTSYFGGTCCRERGMNLC